MSKGIFDISNYAKLYHSSREVRRLISGLEMCKFNTTFLNDSELESLRTSAEFALKVYYNKLNAIVDDAEKHITTEYLKSRRLFLGSRPLRKLGGLFSFSKGRYIHEHSL